MGLPVTSSGFCPPAPRASQSRTTPPKSFAKDNYISLENVLRGSGDFGAFVGAGFGIRQIDKIQNVIHVETIKARDSEPAEPFQIIGRPWIDQEGDFHMHRMPGQVRQAVRVSGGLSRAQPRRCSGTDEGS